MGAKFVRHFTEKLWSEKFNVPNSIVFYENVYKQKIKDIKYNAFGEFNFYVLRNCLSCGYLVGKWNKKVKDKCIRCNVDHTAEHLLFNCETAKTIWQKVSDILKIKLKWKHIVLGFSDTNDTSNMWNIVITIIVFTIHRKWSFFSENQESFHNTNLKSAIAANLLFYGEVFRYTGDKAKIADKIRQVAQEIIL